MSTAVRRPLPPRRARRTLPEAASPVARAGRPSVAESSSTISPDISSEPTPKGSGSEPTPGRKLVVRAVRRMPPYWRTVQDTGPMTREKVRLWRLICSAMHIPCKESGTSFMVPALYENTAREHFRAVAAEGRIPLPPPPPARRNAHWALGLLALLLLWFGITRQWWMPWPAFSVSAWNRMGALDVWQVMHGELYRAVTALTLHGDSQHLFNNLLFGAPFFILLCRRIGTGPGALLAVLSGALGNVGNAVYRVLSSAPTHVSLGFSTALFGIVGALTAIMATREVLHIVRVHRAAPELHHLNIQSPPPLMPGLRRAAVFLAVGVAVLAMLGSDPNQRTDYAAHIFGLLGGLFCGTLYGLVQDRITSGIERCMGAVALLLPALAWLCALNR